MKIKLTYTDQERAAFERVRAELLQTLPNCSCTVRKQATENKR